MCGRPSAASASSTSCWGCSSPPKQKLPDRVTQALSARFEFRHRPRSKPRRRRLEQRLLREHFLHVLGVVGPVGGRVQDAAGGELVRRERGKLRLHHAALVVALLWPRIGKEEVDRGE